MLSEREREYLKQAKRMIKDGRAYYICWALEHISEPGTRRLRGYIAGKLNNDNSLTGWQICNGLNRTCAQRKQDRLDWIDWMLGDK